MFSHTSIFYSFCCKFTFAIHFVFSIVQSLSIVLTRFCILVEISLVYVCTSSLLFDVDRICLCLFSEKTDVDFSACVDVFMCMQLVIDHLDHWFLGLPFSLLHIDVFQAIFSSPLFSVILSMCLNQCSLLVLITALIVGSFYIL